MRARGSWRWSVAGATVGSAIALAACGSGTTPTAAKTQSSTGTTGPAATATSKNATGHGTVLDSKSTAYGRILTTSKGMTLYGFSTDSRSKSACTGTCLAYWKPFLVQGKVIAGTGVVSKCLTGADTLTRSGGTRQLEYCGIPLYTFVGDQHPGQVTGVGIHSFGGVWYLVAVSGAHVLKPGAAKTTTTTPATSTTTPGSTSTTTVMNPTTTTSPATGTTTPSKSTTTTEAPTTTEPPTTTSPPPTTTTIPTTTTWG